MNASLTSGAGIRVRFRPPRDGAIWINESPVFNKQGCKYLRGYRFNLRMTKQFRHNQNTLTSIPYRL
jgi:hypothetical protein